MGLTTTGAAMLADAIIGGSSYTKLNNANAYIGVGNGTTAFAAAQTDLQGASKTRKAMDATYPSRSGGSITLRSTFGSADANHAWEEWGVFNASSSGQMLSRKVESLGTKVSGATWEFTVTLTFA
jgi:hypothetical protein